MGSLFTALCCLGAAPILAGLGAVGLGALATVGGLWVSAIVVGAGLGLLMGGSVWNWALVRRS